MYFDRQMLRHGIFYFIIYGLISPLAFASTLKVGDLIFVSYRPCFSCQVIEHEVDSAYSHLGVVLEIKKHEVSVAEARERVRVLPLKQFLAMANVAKVYRIKGLYSGASFDMKLRARYYKYFHHKPYDSAFSWAEEPDAYYCSELVTKLLNPFLEHKIKIRPMSFKKNWDFWENFFYPAQVPEGELGNNPQSLFQDLELVFIQSLIENSITVEE